MLAQVIVDVPLMQTDQPYSYQIPQRFEGVLEVGMRVHVPFGKGNRLVQGIVTDVIKEEVAVDETIKEITEVLDASPVLNQEQLWLAEQLRKTVFSFKISLLKAMLPNLLHSSYDKRLVAKGNLQGEQEDLMKGRSSLLFSELTSDEQVRAMTFVRNGFLEVEYLATDRKSIKTQDWYEPCVDALRNFSFSSRAKKRQALKEELLENPARKELLSSLRSRYASDVIQFFKQEGLIRVWSEEVSRSAAYFDHREKSVPLQLNPEQAIAVKEIVSQVGQGSQTYLLEGVTGSGKTEVYLQVIEQVLSQGKTAIMLVPEISLTPQVTNRFIARFGQKVAILHSGLSDGEKYDEWRKIEAGKAEVVVGARSAIFAPLKRIGAIIIDEEHEASYKQDSSPRYHAREVALLRSTYHQAVLVLGSATPSLESRARASKGLYHLLRLTQRANQEAVLPSIDVIDFREYIGQQEISNFTPPLLEKIAEKLAKKEQIVLLLNRRGYSSFMMCRDCGSVAECPNCDISLTLHMDTRTMNCHYCGFQTGIPQRCSHCQSKAIRYYGTGTQKAAMELAAFFPQARILRMDVDTTRKKGAHEALLKQFEKGQADILLGTQMIAKGLDFPNVTLVGVLNADTALHLPDFRASERTFQLLTQVAGRAGRADKAGEVLLQTYNPQHYAIDFARKQDYEGFYQYEMSIRRQLGYPPYYFTVRVTLSHASEDIVIQKSYEVASFLTGHLSKEIQLLGPTPKPIARTHQLYHYQLLLKYKREENLVIVLNNLMDWGQSPSQKGLRLVIDSEPQNLM